MISQTTIDNVFETARVEEVIGDFVVLKKSGSNFKGLSPFSDERTPSFMVSPAKQLWKDFSSGKGGSVVSFLMEHEHFSYPEAIKYLANKYGIEFEETERTDEQKEKATQKENLFIVSDYAKEYFGDNHTVIMDVDKKAYLSALALSENIIITCDSSSMISEAALTGKPIYIASILPRKNDKRFQSFRNLFRELNITRNLGEEVENWTYEKLDETNRVANIIKQKIYS